MKCLATKPRSNQHGFTLVELIVVILILGILAINVGSRVFSSSSFSDRKVADELVEALRYAQHIAMSRVGGTGDTIRVITTASDYSVELFDGVTSTAIPNPNKSGDYTVSIPGNTVLSAETVSFNGLGQPASATDQSITVGSPVNFTITIESETGYARY